MAMIEVDPKSFTLSPFEAIGEEWMLIAAEKGGRVNALTAKWGGLGHIWRRPAAYIFIRPQRYTKEFIDGSGTFSINFFKPDRKPMLTYFGTVSGRDEDKVAKTGLTVLHADNAPYFAEAKASILCRKWYAQPMEEKYFTDPWPNEACYPEKDYHFFYVGEVLRILAEKDAF